MGKSKKQLADEAYTRSMEQLDGLAPAPEGVLIGQHDIDGSVAGTSGYAVERPIKGAPRYCPGCGADMIVVYGGSWTPMFAKTDDVTDAPVPGEATKLQCGLCSRIVPVTHATWLEVKKERRRTVGRRDQPHPKKKPKRERGAG